MVMFLCFPWYISHFCFPMLVFYRPVNIRPLWLSDPLRKISFHLYSRAEFPAHKQLCHSPFVVLPRQGPLYMPLSGTRRIVHIRYCFCCVRVSPHPNRNTSKDLAQPSLFHNISPLLKMLASTMFTGSTRRDYYHGDLSSSSIRLESLKDHEGEKASPAIRARKSNGVRNPKLNFQKEVFELDDDSGYETSQTVDSVTSWSTCSLSLKDEEASLQDISLPDDHSSRRRSSAAFSSRRRRWSSQYQNELLKDDMSSLYLELEKMQNSCFEDDFEEDTDSEEEEVERGTITKNGISISRWPWILF